MTGRGGAGHKGPTFRRGGPRGRPAGWGVKFRHQKCLEAAPRAADAPRHASLQKTARLQARTPEPPRGDPLNAPSLSSQHVRVHTPQPPSDPPPLLVPLFPKENPGWKTRSSLQHFLLPHLRAQAVSMSAAPWKYHSSAPPFCCHTHPGPSRPLGTQSLLPENAEPFLLGPPGFADSS